MKVVFITTVNPSVQGDLLELSILHGMRSVLGANCIDFPRKKIMYHDFAESPKNSLHGRGFSLLTTPLDDLSQEQRKIEDINVIIYGSGHMYGESRIPEIEEKCDNIWFLDGHDLYGHAPRKIIHNNEEIIATQFEKCFKRELVEKGLNKVFPSGFGIPIERIRPINLETKTQLFQKTAPDDSLFKEIKDFGVGGGFQHHTFDKEEDYYEDLSKSWFGLTCKKGGWDCLRHYEIIAGGCLLLFKDYELKPKQCSPQNLPCISYSSKEQLEDITNTLIANGKPTPNYIKLLFQQREWLFSTGTTEARALKILQTINEE